MIAGTINTMPVSEYLYSMCYIIIIEEFRDKVNGFSVNIAGKIDKITLCVLYVFYK
jgi:hypothetical protein